RFIDRLVSLLGARKLAEKQANIGYLLIEVIPAMVWGFICGAMAYEGYYLIKFFRLLGAQDWQVALLPLMYFSAFALQYFILRKKNAEESKESKAQCVKVTVQARALWLLIPLWPACVELCQWSHQLSIYGVLIIFFIAHIRMFVGLMYFMTWTQSVIDNKDRGAFFAWRSIGVNLTLITCVFCVSYFWPENLNDTQTFWWYIGLFTIITLGCLLSTLLLHWSPDMQDRDQEHLSSSISTQTIMRQNPQLKSLIYWGAFNGAAACFFITWFPEHMDSLQVDEKDISHWQYLVEIPMKICGFLFAAWCMRRTSSLSTLFIAVLMWPIFIMLYLLLNTDNLWYLLPMCMGLYGLSRAVIQISGVTSLQNLAPRHDIRIPAYNFFAFGLGGFIASILMLIAVHPLRHAFINNTWPWTIPETMFCAAGCCQVIGMYILLRGMRANSQ
ncbi:MAG: hypothetical protein HRU15_15475, partial [Planctomycetes bacterium]|nr:hypothetical protein [Planctomycetota bacterium]